MSLVKREANSAAHTLAKAASKEVLNSICLEDILDNICKIVTRELVVPKSRYKIILVFLFIRLSVFVKKKKKSHRDRK
jgi:hypothetical protein